jgi:hypothetical protein
MLDDIFSVKSLRDLKWITALHGPELKFTDPMQSAQPVEVT